MRVIIGLVGPSGAGKTTAARYLVQEYGFVAMHAVDALKRGLAAMFPEWDPARMEERVPWLGGGVQRAVAESVGIAIRGAAPNALTTAFERALYERSDPRIVVDGLRAQDEADIVDRAGGCVIRITGAVDPRKPMDVSQEGVGSDYRVYRVDDSSDLYYFYRQIDRVAARILGDDHGRRPNDC